MKLYLFLLIHLVFFAACNSQADQEKLIKDCFYNYKSAILNGDGKMAVEYVDSRTINYYDDMANKSVTSDSLALDSLSLVDKLMIVSIRFRTPNEQIKNFDGQSLFVYAVESGMIGKNSLLKNGIGDIYIDKDFAAAKFVADGKVTSINYHFYKEESWKIDLTEILPLGNSVMKKMLDKSGKSEYDFLFDLLETITGKRPSYNILNPI